jgi:HSP20 family protein
VERSHGTFRRVIPLPQGANLEAAQARFENGVLEIDIPFQQQSKSRRLEVRTGSTSGSASGSTSDPTRH